MHHLKKRMDVLQNSSTLIFFIDLSCYTGTLTPSILLIHEFIS